MRNTNRLFSAFFLSHTAIKRIWHQIALCSKAMFSLSVQSERGFTKDSVFPPVLSKRRGLTSVRSLRNGPGWHPLFLSDGWGKQPFLEAKQRSATSEGKSSHYLSPDNLQPLWAETAPIQQAQISRDRRARLLWYRPSERVCPHEKIIG